MAKSMTGYGRAEAEREGKIISVELRSVNNRYFDCTVKLPRMYIFAEDMIRKRVQNGLTRGKVDVFVGVNHVGGEDFSVSLNRPVARGYLSALRAMAEEFSLRDDSAVSLLAHFPDVLSVEKQARAPDEAAADICAVLEEALCAHEVMRAREGERLVEDIRARMDAIAGLTAKIEKRSPQTTADYRSRLEQRMREVLESAAVDEQRLLTEAALFADKTAVAEETVRLRSHLSQLDKMLAEGGPIGRKLDFLIQEFNREANTIGSKANDMEISVWVVDMKAEIEKIREQVQNIE